MTYKEWMDQLVEILSKEEPSVKDYQKSMDTLVKFCDDDHREIPALFLASCIHRFDEMIETEMHKVRSVLRTVPVKCNWDSMMFLGKELPRL